MPSITLYVPDKDLATVRRAARLAEFHGGKSLSKVLVEKSKEIVEHYEPSQACDHRNGGSHIRMPEWVTKTPGLVKCGDCGREVELPAPDCNKPDFRQTVERAYREGWCAGHRAASGDQNPDVDWELSKAKKALSRKKARTTC